MDHDPQSFSTSLNYVWAEQVAVLVVLADDLEEGPE